MKFTPEVVVALAVLRENAENDFERHRIFVLERDLTAPPERDLTAPPQVEVIDDTHQRFDGMIYTKEKQGHYRATFHIHRVIWAYCHGEISGGCDIHHSDENPANNSIENLQCLTKSEHMRIHGTKDEIQKVCPVCGKSFLLNRRFPKKICCSPACGHKFAGLRRDKGTVEKTCPACGKIFVTKNTNQVCCSRSCAAKIQDHPKKPLVEKSCPVCGRVFIARKPTQIYCSFPCSTKVSRPSPLKKPLVEKNCVICGKKFKVPRKHLSNLCCSRSCATKLQWQTRKSKK